VELKVAHSLVMVLLYLDILVVEAQLEACHIRLVELVEDILEVVVLVEDILEVVLLVVWDTLGVEDQPEPNHIHLVVITFVAFKL
jgi:hypothetical protein